MINHLRLRLRIIKTFHLQILIPPDQRLGDNFGRKQQIKVLLGFFWINLAKLNVVVFREWLIFLLTVVDVNQTGMQTQNIRIFIRILEIKILDRKLTLVIHLLSFNSKVRI